jgi:polyhydroxyalkanoate synthase
MPFPQLKPEEHRNLFRILNGLERVFLGPLRPEITTPSDVVWMWERSLLLRYELPHFPPKYRIPVLIVPPLMVKPWIFDLRPGHSMVGFFVRSGFDTFMLDYGIPGDPDRTIRVDDYVADFIPNAISKIKEATRAPAVSLIGWSMGGIMGYTYCGLYGPESGVENLVTIGAPLDFSKMYPFNLLARFSGMKTVELAIDFMGNIPPFLTKNAFKLMNPLKLITRRIQALRNLWDRDWIAGYEALHDWVEDFIPYPGAAFKQFVQDYIKDDRLRSGSLKIRGQYIELKRIQVSLLVVMGTEDDVAPLPSVEPALKEIPVSDKHGLRVPLGHIGLIAGHTAPRLVWEPVAEWLRPRSN